MSADETLASAQAALLRALTGAGEPPAGFDPGRVQATARLLADKRLRSAARACPALRRELGARLSALFGEFTRATRSPTSHDAHADADCFLGWLRNRGELTDGLRVVAIELRLRRSPGVVVAWLRTERRLLAGVRLPAAPAWLVSIPRR